MKFNLNKGKEMQERQTKQKQAIYDALVYLDHPTATEVYGRVHEINPKVSRATVFRVLNGFAASGKALELRLAGQETRYDYNVTPHAHARCKICGRLSDVEVLGMPSAGLRAIPCDGFEIEGYMVEFYGSCKECGKIC